MQISSIRELEDLIIDAIYLDIIRGKLDQKEQQFEVEYTMGRDLEPGKIGSLLQALKDWCARSLPPPVSLAKCSYRSSTTASVLSTLDNQLATLSAHNSSLASQGDEHERMLVSNLRDVLERQREGKPSGPSKRVVAGVTGRKEREEREEDMDIDDPTEWTKRNRKYCLVGLSSSRMFLTSDSISQGISRHSVKTSQQTQSHVKTARVFSLWCSKSIGEHWD